MRRRLALVGAAVLGALGGAGATATIQDAGGASGERTPEPWSSSTLPLVEQAAPSDPSIADQHLLLAWTAGGLPPAFDELVALAVPGVRGAVVVHGDPLPLVESADGEGKAVGGHGAPAEGWVVELDVVAVDPIAYAGVVAAADRTAVAGLRPGEALLGATSARLRGLGPGSSLRFAGGGAVTVATVVPDEAVGGAELAVDRATGASLGVTTPRALVVVHEGDRAAVEAALNAALPPGTPVRFRAPGETPFLRAGDAVLPPTAIKDAFGEPAHRVVDPSTGEVELDPAWVAANITSAEVPLLGPVRCHRAILPALVGAMTELTQKHLVGAIGSFDGCWVPRLVGPGRPLSRHAWGVAIDLNYAANPTGTGSAQDPRLVEVLERWGFTWGGRWLDPDPAHFEYVSPPR